MSYVVIFCLLNLNVKRWIIGKCSWEKKIGEKRSRKSSRKDLWWRRCYDRLNSKRSSNIFSKMFRALFFSEKLWFAFTGVGELKQNKTRKPRSGNFVPITLTVFFRLSHSKIIMYSTQRTVLHFYDFILQKCRMYKWCINFPPSFYTVEHFVCRATRSKMYLGKIRNAN